MTEKPWTVESHFEALSLMFRQRQEELIESLSAQFAKRLEEFDKIDQDDFKKIESFICQERIRRVLFNFITPLK